MRPTTKRLQTTLLGAALLSTTLLGASCAGFDPERLGHVLGGVAIAAMPIGPEKETEIGFGIATTVAGRYPILNDPELTRYVNLVGHAVAEQSPRRHEINFRFAVLDAEEINAFAAPGGYIFITHGALAVMESEAELAGVLGHEIGHIDAKHVIDEIRRADMIRTAQEEAELSGALLDRIAEMGTGLLFTGLSREDELEADELGLLYASATGYRADGLLDFIERLRTLEDEDDAEGRLRELQATHPSADDRLQALHQRLIEHSVTPDEGETLAERFNEHIALSR